MDYFNDRLIVPLANWLARDPNLVDFGNLTRASLMLLGLFAGLAVLMFVAEMSVRRRLVQGPHDSGHIREDIEASLAYDGSDEVTLPKAEVAALLDSSGHPALPQSPLSVLLKLLGFLCGVLAIVAAYWAYRYYTHA